jgi:Glycosyl transferase family 11
MIYFYGEGRLGNQIFQYQALSRIARANERILSVGLEDLQSTMVLNGPKLFVLTRRRPAKLLVKYLLNAILIRPLARTLRLFNYAAEGVHDRAPNPGANGVLSVRKGLMRRFTFVDGGHYQNSAYWPRSFPTPAFKVNEALRVSARRHLHAVPPGWSSAFVHVRRTDYLTHTDYGLTDLGLSTNYYRDALRELRARVDNLYLFFVTDDPDWVEANFADITHKSISSQDPGVDFAIMTECDCGIMANSTFSLAAALLMENPKVVIGPLHWNGFRVKTWYPPRIEFSDARLLYLPANV